MKKVIVAMSGGIDSSVAAALLKGAGFDVVGAFMKFWFPENADHSWNRCCSPDSERRARAMAKILKIPFYVFNFEEEFKKKIVDYFLKGYKKGITPNPCVVCNKEIKFGLLFKKVLELDADYIATGHYVRQRQGRLFCGKDKEKDQSYFLWQLKQEQLKRILFPIGDYKKSEVRKLASQFKLPFARVPESMEVCFIPGTTEEFLAKYLKTKPGSIVDPKGKELGWHRGLYFYTIGQRKGIGLSGGPYWVAAKDFGRNRLVVSKNEKDLLRKEMIVTDVQWIAGKAPAFPLKAKVKIRYRTPAILATVSRSGKGKCRVSLGTAQRAVASGQSAVFYAKKNNELLGGGVIG